MLAVFITFKGGRGGAQNDGAVEKLAANHGHVATVITESILLLVRRIMFLIDDDETETGNRCEHRRASADDDIDFSMTNLLPLRPAFRLGESAVKHADLLREASMESIQKLRCQGDFGNQNKTFSAKFFGSLHRADVNFGFAAASDAVQQESFEAGHFDSTFDCAERVVLLGGQVKSHWNVDCRQIGRGKKLVF